MKEIFLLLTLLPSSFGFAGVGEACYEQVNCGADLTIESLTSCYNCMDCEDSDSCEYCVSGIDAGLDAYFDTCTDMDEVDFDPSIYGMYSCNGTMSGYPVYLQYSDSACTALVAEDYYTCQCDDDDEEDDDSEDCGVYSTWACDGNGTSFTTKSECDSDSCDNCAQEYTFEESPWEGGWDCFTTDGSMNYGFTCMDSEVIITVYSDDNCTSWTGSAMIGCDDDCNDDDDDERRRLKLDGSKKVKPLLSPRTKKQVTKSIKQFKKKSSQLHSTKK